MPVKVISKRVGMSPIKIRRSLGLIRGKTAKDALDILKLIPSPAAREVAKVVKSAMANAENNLLQDPIGMRVIKAVADDGPKAKRFRPQSRGRISPIIKRTSHITVTLE